MAKTAWAYCFTFWTAAFFPTSIGMQSIYTFAKIFAGRMNGGQKK